MAYPAWPSGIPHPSATKSRTSAATLGSPAAAALFHLYGISEAAADYILESFPIVKPKDVEKHGTYRTKVRSRLGVAVLDG